jgi:hypothetical protein
MPLLQIIFIACRQKDASSFHLVSHFEDCSHGVTLTCELICLENFMERFLLLGWTCHNGQCNYVRSCGLFSLISITSFIWTGRALINYSCFYWLVRGAPTKVCFFSFILKAPFWSTANIFGTWTTPKHGSLNMLPTLQNRSMLCHASLGAPPLYKLYTWKLNHGQKIWDKKWSDSGNILRNTLTIWGTLWKSDRNTLGTWWEDLGTKKNTKKS